MSDFRIFCELLAKMMLESIDFTDVLEGYRRNEKPEILGIATFWANMVSIHMAIVEMKSPRYWALQPLPLFHNVYWLGVEMKSPRYWALQPLFHVLSQEKFRRNEKPEVV